MKQGFVAAIIAVVVVLGLGVGYLLSAGGLSGVASSNYEKRIKELEESVDFLAQTLAQVGPSGGGGSFKIAFVDMFKVLESLYTLENEVVKKALADFEAERERIEAAVADIRKKFEDGEITLKEQEQQLIKLETELQSRNLELSAPIQREILGAVKKLGQERGYGIILDNPASKYAPIILDARAGMADDITQQVIDLTKESLKVK